MTPVVWTKSARDDLEDILAYVAARSPQGAATIARRVEEAILDIATFPRAARRDPETGTFEWVVGGVPLLLIYELISSESGDDGQADIIAVFNTDRNPAGKPGRRDSPSS
jgi:plasmid stabilization system protein ParE